VRAWRNRITSEWIVGQLDGHRLQVGPGGGSSGDPPCQLVQSEMVFVCQVSKERTTAAVGERAYQFVLCRSLTGVRPGLR
jgi:hypothetical protein